MEIEYEKLRYDLYDYCMTAYWQVGQGIGMIYAERIKEASLEELLAIANYLGFDIEQYVIGRQR